MKKIFLKLFIFIAISGIYFSCATSEDNNDANAKKFNLVFGGESVNAPFKLSMMIDSNSVRYIPIDSAWLISRVDEIKYMKGFFYIMDQSLRVIHVVDENGKLIFKIDKCGHASNEYVLISDFDVSPVNNEIHIYDFPSKKILVYSSDGKYLRNIRVDKNDVINDFAVLDNGDYLFYTPDYHSPKTRRGLWQTDSNGKFKKQLVTISNDFKYGGLYPEYLRRIDDKTIGLMGGEDHDRIYRITSDSITTTYKINFNIKIPKNIRKESVIDTKEYKGKIYSKYDYFENNRWMTFGASDMEKSIRVFYDKKNNIPYVITKQQDLINDVDTYGMMQLSSYNREVNVLYPSTILAYPVTHKRFPNITSESNPVIVVSQVKL